MPDQGDACDQWARGKAAEALQAAQSLGREMEIRFENIDQRLHDFAAATSESETRTNKSQTDGENRLKTEMGAIEIRLLAAIGKIETAMNTQSATYSNRFWDTTTKIIVGLVGVLWAIAFAYVGSGQAHH
jgi:hypothetical protein